MTDQQPIERRLESWREVVRTGSPAWLADLAPRIIQQLEAELAALVEGGKADAA